MNYVLPPGTEHRPPTGELTTNIKLIYLDSSIEHLCYNMRFWGYSKPVPIDSETLTTSFKITVNLTKLT